MSDLINKPAHYTKGTIEPIDFIEANRLDFFEGNIIKYLVRHKHRNGLEDLKKAKVYLDKLISYYIRVGDIQPPSEACVNYTPTISTRSIEKPNISACGSTIS